MRFVTLNKHCHTKAIINLHVILPTLQQLINVLIKTTYITVPECCLVSAEASVHTKQE